MAKTINIRYIKLDPYWNEGKLLLKVELENLLAEGYTHLIASLQYEIVTLSQALFPQETVSYTPGVGENFIEIKELMKVL